MTHQRPGHCFLREREKKKKLIYAVININLLRGNYLEGFCPFETEKKLMLEFNCTYKVRFYLKWVQDTFENYFAN